MPVWFKNRLKEAYYKKDRYQIKLLNQCWFFYKERHGSE
ncbi:cortex morphogenetic protein CmpA [Terrilactibacillus sp. S3-3]|nr:cortex morphogenetic protein CmpA [Terrilactibacillus sp. S3-3]